MWLTIHLTPTEAQETRNERALAVYNRVQNKLTGTYYAAIGDDPDFPVLQNACG